MQESFERQMHEDRVTGGERQVQLLAREEMGMSKALQRCFTKKYATFTGRASRSEYWWFALACFLVSAVLSIISFGLLGGLFSLVSIIPSFAVGVRRMHDIGRSGWWYVAPGIVAVLGFIIIMFGRAAVIASGSSDFSAAVGGWLFILVWLLEFILGLTLLYFTVKPSQKGTNQYGPQPPETL